MAMGVLQQVRQSLASGRVQRLVPCDAHQQRAHNRKHMPPLHRNSRHDDVA